MELLLLADAARRAGAACLTAVIPYFGYARQDRRNAEGGPIAARLIAELLDTRFDRLIRVTMDHGPKLGIALGGGGARGIAHIGVLKVLEGQHIFPGFITGTSIGALVGAAYAVNPQIADLEKRVIEVLAPDNPDKIPLANFDWVNWQESLKSSWMSRLTRSMQKQVFLLMAIQIGEINRKYCDVLIHLDTGDIHWLHFQDCENLIRQGQLAAESMIDPIREAVAPQIYRRLLHSLVRRPQQLLSMPRQL